MPTRARARLLVATIVLAAGAAAVAACVGDEDTASPGADGGTPEASTGTPDTSTSSADSSAPPPADAGADVEEISDGGGLLPEDDAGADPDDGGLDGGFDAGPACSTLTPGAFVTSTCASKALFLAGGALTTTKYVLSNVQVLGSPTFCGVGGGFAPYEHRGALEVTAKNATTATFEFVDQYRKAGAITRPTPVRYDVTVAASGTTLTYTPTACAQKPAPAQAGYSVSTDANTGKKVLILRLPYGTGNANYRFVEP